jgi:NADPH:quinone reductase-like Zn-dependent oxidoreductase
MQMLAVCTTGKADGTTELQRVEVPQLAEDEVRVKVVAAAANPADCKL